MSRIDELIAELCPDGVEFCELKKLTQCTANIKWVDVDGDEFRYIDLTSVDRITHTIIETQQINSKNAPSRAQQIVHEGDVIFATTRPMLKRYTVISAENDGDICSTGYCVLRPKQNRVLSNFVFHLLGTESFYAHVVANERGASYPAISDSAVKAFRIPVPPLDVQREIVKILDTFTQLEAELEAELEARRRQYQYYRGVLLNCSGCSGVSRIDELIAELCPEGVEFKELGKVAEIKRGTSITKNFVSAGNVPVIAGGRTPAYFHNTSNRDGQTIVIAGSGAYAGFVSWWDQPIFVSDAFSVKTSNTLLPKFCYYWLQNIQQQLHELKSGGGVPHVYPRDVAPFRIPVPPLDVQREIVKILDTFDALVNDLSSGLPAEIKARRQQYEHYRNRLLTFKEAI